jgi:hypothetical protein
MATSDQMINSVLDTAVSAYQAGIDQEPALTEALFQLMSDYVAIRLHVTPPTASLLFTARLALIRVAKALDSS